MALTVVQSGVGGTGNTNLTYPSTGGTVMVSGAMPAFSAYQSSAQNLSNGVTTKIQFQTKEFDTANCFDNATNYRFTPNVAGYYQVNSTINIQGNGGNNFINSIYKNGAELKRGNQVGVNSAGNNGVVVSALIYLNGSTDYIEIYGFVTGTSNVFYGSSIYTWVTGSLVRTA